MAGRAADTILLILTVGVAVALTIGGYVGMIYWAFKGWALGSVLSAFLPGFGALSVFLAMMG